MKVIAQTGKITLVLIARVERRHGIHMKRSRQKIYMTQVVGCARLNKADADLRHTGCRAMGKTAVKVPIERSEKYIYDNTKGGEEDLRHAGVRFWPCMFQHVQERRTRCCRQAGKRINESAPI